MLIVAWLLVLLHTLAQSSPVATLAPFNPDIEFASLMHFYKGATATHCFCSPASRSGFTGCHTFCRCTVLPLLQCSFHSLRLLPTLILRDNNILRSLHSHRTAVSRQELNSARHPVPSFAHYTTGAFPQSLNINQSFSASLRILQPSLLRTSLQSAPSKAPCVSFAQFHSLPHCIKHLPKPIPTNKKMRHPG